MFGAMSAGLTYGIGHGGENNGALFGANTAEKALMHGVAQGTISVLRGGEFRTGLVSGFVGSVSGSATEEMGRSIQNDGIRLVISTSMGGVASRATGGSFEDGAVSAATVFLFNHAADFDNLADFFNELEEDFKAFFRGDWLKREFTDPIVHVGKKVGKTSYTATKGALENPAIKTATFLFPSLYPIKITQGASSLLNTVDAANGDWSGLASQVSGKAFAMRNAPTKYFSKEMHQRAEFIGSETANQIIPKPQDEKM